MKLISFEKGGQRSFGAVVDGGVVDLGARLPEIGSLKALLRAGLRIADDAVRGAKADFPLTSVRLLPVIPDPDKIFMAATNYEDHLRETNRQHTANPVIFLRVAASQIAHGDPIIRPFLSDKLDYEGELALIIGKPGRHIQESDAMSHVAGYACYNDGTIRDWQQHSHQFTPGKNFANTGAFGPWMMTSDEIADPFNLDLVTRLNGQEVQRTNTSLMIHSMQRLIAYCSAFIGLETGDVIVTGTCGGVGFKRTPQLFMKAGDVVEVEIESVGRLINTIADEVRA